VICESYYWRGKLGVVLLDMRNAKYWLDKAWRFCPEDAWQQKRYVSSLCAGLTGRAILIRLIPVNLLLGRLPSKDLIQHYDLAAFAPLLQAYRTGNIVAWRRVLDTDREWFRSRSIWLILYERGEILVWRNLFRNA
jgi:hypothetical protein